MPNVTKLCLCCYLLGLPASDLPTTVHLDLMANGLLSDPYFSDNLLAATYLELEEPVYRLIFDTQIREGTLVFHGLDTHCDVYLNGQRILHANNMFRVWRVPNLTFVTKSNNLTVQFYSSPKLDLASQTALYSQYNFSLPYNYSFTRKAAYQYGWDWGPRLVTTGIWNHVFIQGLEPQVTHISVRNSKVVAESSTSAVLKVSAELQHLQNKTNYTLRATIKSIAKPTEFFTGALIITDSSQTSVSFFDITVSPVQLWFTHDLGNPSLYTVNVSLYDPSNVMLHSKQVRYGIRTVQVSQATQGNGTEFAVVLNGIKTFMRGGNYIPPDMFMPRALKNPQVYYNTIEAALFANYNMIRVWGGGQFDYDIFYDLCDEKGLLIWHDLMFACAMYPGTPEFLDNVKNQMVDNLKRLRNHPSIALWNGNNEVWIGWLEWGWKSGKNSSQIALIQGWYDKIFRVTIGGTISSLDPDRFYWITSPSSSSNDVATIVSGDIHFWRVWGGGTPIEQYKQFVGRFNSQYGMQSAPDFFSILKFTKPEDRSIDSFVMRLHQRHIMGDKYLPMYTTDNVGYSASLSVYSYLTQLMQSYAVETAIAALRGANPYCMGSLYWQLNDVWPVSSWAAVDYYGSYKAAHYQMRRSYTVYYNNFYEVRPNNSSQSYYEYRIYNDGTMRGFVTYRYRIMDVYGNVLREKKASVLLMGGTRVVASTIYDMETLVTNKNSTFIVCEVWNGAQTQKLTKSIYYFVRPKQMVAPVPQIQLTKLQAGIWSLKSNTLAKGVFLHTESESVKASDNYFDLVPQQEYTVTTDPSVQNMQVTHYFALRAKEAFQNLQEE